MFLERAQEASGTTNENWRLFPQDFKDRNDPGVSHRGEPCALWCGLNRGVLWGTLCGLSEVRRAPQCCSRFAARCPPVAVQQRHILQVRQVHRMGAPWLAPLSGHSLLQPWMHAAVPTLAPGLPCWDQACLGGLGHACRKTSLKPCARLLTEHSP